MNKNIGDMSESELKDFIIELQEENSRYERKNKKYKEVIDEANKKLTNMFDNGDDNKILDDLLELSKILEVE